MKTKAEPPVGDLVSDIATEIAAEEHRQGLPYRPDSDHCRGCADEATRQKQAACPHDDPVEYTTQSVDGRVVVHHAYCGACGAGQPDWDFKMTKVLG